MWLVVYIPLQDCVTLKMYIHADVAELSRNDEARNEPVLLRGSRPCQLADGGSIHAAHSNQKNLKFADVAELVYAPA